MLQFDQSTYVPEVCESKIHYFLCKTFGITKTVLRSLTGYEDKNYCLEQNSFKATEGPEKLILKISNPVEAATAGHIEFQVKLSECLRANGIPTAETFPTVDGRQFSLEEVAPGVFLPVRVFRFLEGRILEDFDFSSDLVQELGKTMAQFHKIVDEAKTNILILHEEAVSLKESGFISTEQLLLIENGCFQYEKLTETVDLDRGVIHSDFNETNILIANGEITGLLDLGDVHVAPRAMDIASLVLYLQLSDRLQQGISKLAKNVLLGYRSIRDFSDCDEAILVCMRARLCCSLIYGLRTAKKRGENSDGYVLKTQKPGWLALEELLSRPRLINDQR